MTSTDPHPLVWLIRFRCGHRQRRNLRTTPAGERAGRAALIARGLCPACRRVVDRSRTPTRDGALA